MKGPKIENIRDPKWVGKKIVMGEFSVSPDKLIFVGNGQICTQNRFNTLSLWPIDCYDWHEWIEPEEEKKPEFPFKVGDKLVKKTWQDGDLEYLKLFDISENNFEIATYPRLDHYYTYCPDAIREDILKNPRDWETYTPPKKKKTVAFALIDREGGPCLSYFTYKTQEELKEVIGEKILQFPAVTSANVYTCKDETVLELEVDDDS